MSLLDRRTPEARFWDWFVANRTTLVKPTSPRLMEELTKRLRQVHPELAWEAGPLPDGTVEFAVSADGIKEVAPHVRRVVGAAPPILGWTIRAFRQPSADAVAIRLGNRRLSLDDLAFVARAARADRLLDLTVLIRDLSGGSQEQMIHAAFLLLDSLLGEEAVMFRLGELDFAPLAEGDGGERPITALPALLASN